MGASHVGALRLIVDELVHLRYGSVEDRHLVSVVVHVQHQILAHDRETDQTNITGIIYHTDLLKHAFAVWARASQILDRTASQADRQSINVEDAGVSAPLSRSARLSR